MRIRILRSTAALAAVTGLAVAAPTARAMTIRVGDPALVARVVVAVPVSVSCSPFDPSYTHTSDSISVSIEQASGRGVAAGSASVFWSIFGMGQPTQPFACDGTEQTTTVSVPANPSGPPFHGGPAAVTATASATAGLPCFPGSTNCFTSNVTQSATTGAVAIHLS
jgi:hypothetical protein